jgi:hypothetical protein
MENSREAEIFEANWAHRVKSDYDAAWKEWELQLEMDRIGNQDLNTEHGEKATDPIGKSVYTKSAYAKNSKRMTFFN